MKKSSSLFGTAFRLRPPAAGAVKLFFVAKMFHVKHFASSLIKAGSKLHIKNSIPFSASEPGQEELYFTP